MIMNLLCLSPMMSKGSSCNEIRPYCQQYYYTITHDESKEKQKERCDQQSTALFDQKLLCRAGQRKGIC